MHRRQFLTGALAAPFVATAGHLWIPPRRPKLYTGTFWIEEISYDLTKPDDGFTVIAQLVEKDLRATFRVPADNLKGLWPGETLTISLDRAKLIEEHVNARNA